MQEVAIQRFEGGESIESITNIGEKLLHLDLSLIENSEVSRPKMIDV